MVVNGNFSITGIPPYNYCLKLERNLLLMKLSSLLKRTNASMSLYPIENPTRIACDNKHNIVSKISVIVEI